MANSASLKEDEMSVLLEDIAALGITSSAFEVRVSNSERSTVLVSDCHDSSVSPAPEAHKPCLFNPSTASTDKSDQFHDTLQILFRAFSPQSRGTNNDTVIASHAIANRVPSYDLFSLTEPESESEPDAKGILQNHLRWKTILKLSRCDNLVSWTGSLAFVLQMAIRMTCSYPCAPESDVYVCILDTTKLDRRCFLLADKLFSHFDLETTLTHRAEYFVGEYLSQGHLDIAGISSTTTLAALIKRGLYRDRILLEPQPEEKKQLWIPVRDLRNKWGDPAVGPQ